jgi:hypothetical protein
VADVVRRTLAPLVAMSLIGTGLIAVGLKRYQGYSL